MNTPIMTITELAAYLQIHPATIYRLIKKHQIPYWRIGPSGRGDYRFNAESINRWQTQQEIKPHE